MDKETQDKINQLQMYEQSLQNILMQKQQFQAQLQELESAMKEMQDSPQAYKIIGNIMVESNKENLEEELRSKRSSAELRIKTLEKQEENIRHKTKDLQADVMSQMKEDDS